jgi:arylsulfatase A
VNYYRLLLSAMLCVATSATRLSAAEGMDAKPNIIVIMVDDMGYEWLSCYGGESVQTPELDGLAANGVRFNQAYATPLCTPSRVEIMTGRYSNRNYAGFGNYPEGEPSFAILLKDAGYATSTAGKWQLNVNPNDVGFDQYCLWHIKHPILYEAEKIKYPKGGDGRYWIPQLFKNGEWLPSSETDYGPDICTDFVCDFIVENRARPFLVYYPMILPHFPFVPTPLEIDRDAPIAERTQEGAQNFPGMVRYMDKLVGRIKATLAENGLTENTLIIFTSDNGTQGSITATLNGSEYAGGKGRMTDNGTRVPLIASWPAGGVKKSATSEELVDLTDILPTLAHAAGIEMPAPERIDGKSFLPVLRNPSASRRDWVISYFVDHRDSYSLGYWVRNQRWKLYNDGRLFDMQNDPDESRPIDSPEQDATRKAFEGVFKEQEVTDNMLNEYLIKQGKAPQPPKTAKALSILGKSAGGKKPPNILVFCMDDLSEGLISCYGGAVPTPNIDKIAENGIRFTQGYSTAPMCSPARVALLTGRYQAQRGVDGNFKPQEAGDPASKGLDKGEPTLAERLKALGYQTGISGKWHLGEDEGYLPVDRGFDYGFGTVANLKMNKKTRKGEGDFFRDSDIIHKPGWLVTSPMFADEANKFLELNKDRPFFLYVSFNAAHAPAVYSERWAKKYADVPKAGGQQRKTAQVGEMDEAIGVVMQKLRELNLEENTLVFCLSDNGRMDFVGGLEGLEGSNGLRGDKWKLWEAGVRVPWIVQWKGTLPAGKVLDQVVSHLDMVPTALAAANAKIDPVWKLDGVNLLPLLRGKTDTLDRDALYWRVGNKIEGIHSYAIRQGDWKLVKPDRESEVFLYNLSDDRGERTDLSSNFPERKTNLQKTWAKWSESMPNSVNR